MAVSFICPACAKKLRVRDEAAGKMIRCPDCATSVMVSSWSAIEDLPEPEEDFGRIQDSKPRIGKKSKLGKRAIALLRQYFIAVALAMGVAIFGAVFYVGGAALINVAERVTAPQELPNGWRLFKHPVGEVQIEFPKAPKYNAAASVGGARTYSVIENEYQMSVSFKPFPYRRSQAQVQDQAEVFKMMKPIRAEMESAREMSVISSTSFLCSETHVYDFRLQHRKGKYSNNVRYVILPGGIVKLEYVGIGNAASDPDWRHFLDSLRGPDGKLICDPESPVDPSN